MSTRKIPNGSRAVRTFEVITPAGRVYRFRPLSLPQRLAKLFLSCVDIAAISVTIPVLSYVLGLAAEDLDNHSMRVTNG